MNGRRFHRSLCAVACAALCGASSTASAFATNAANTLESSRLEQEPLSDREEARTLYQAGKVAFDLANFDEAIEKFEQAYALMSAANDPDTYKVLAVIVRNLSLAHRKAFELKRQAINLQKALILLKRYQSQLGDIVPSESFTQADIDTQLGDAAEAIAELAALIASLEPEPKPKSAADPTQAEVEDDSGVSPAQPPGKPAKPMFVAGGAMLGLGVAGAAVGITGALMGASATNKVADSAPLDDRQNLISKGGTGNLLAFIGIGVGSVGVIAGVALVAVGVKRKRAGGTATDISFAPILGREQAGIQARWRF